jgi:hypothetical protein
MASIMVNNIADFLFFNSDAIKPATNPIVATDAMRYAQL